MAATVEIVDVNGSFARFIKNAAPVIKRHVAKALAESRQAVKDRMVARAPVGPNAPHMRDAIEVRDTAIGVFDPDQAEVALFNEYRPNEQPFMRSSLEEEDGPNTRRVIRALEAAEAELSISAT